MNQALRNDYHATRIRLSLNGMVFYKAVSLSCVFVFFSSFYSQIRCIELRVLETGKEFWVFNRIVY